MACLPCPRDGEQSGKPGAVIRHARAAEAALAIHADIVFAAGRDDGVEVRGKGHVRTVSEPGDDIAGAVGRRLPAERTKLLGEPHGALPFEKGRRRNPAKLQVHLVDPLLFAGEPLQAVAHFTGVGDFAQLGCRGGDVGHLLISVATRGIIPVRLESEYAGRSAG